MLNHAGQNQSNQAFRLSITIIGWGLFVAMLGQPSWIGSLPIKFLLKDTFHFQPHELALFLTLGSAAWYLKPAVAVFTDSVPINGSSRRIYLLLGSGGAMSLWLLLLVTPRTSGTLLTMIMLLNLAVVMASTVLGGVIVEVGQQYSATGRISSMRSMVKNCAVMIAGPLTGFLSLRFLGLTAAIGASLFASLFILACFLPERVNISPDLKAWQNAKLRIYELFHAKSLWAAASMLFLVQLAPGFNTPLFFYQTNVLQFEGPFIGILNLASGFSGVLAGLVYAYGCRRFPLRSLLFFAIVFHAASSLAYLGYNTKNSAVFIECLGGFATVLAQIPLFDLAARAVPKGCEALGYSLMMSFWNFGVDASDVFGSWLFELYGLNLTDLVWINCGSTLLTLFVFGIVPAHLHSKTDH